MLISYALFMPFKCAARFMHETWFGYCDTIDECIWLVLLVDAAGRIF